MDNDEPHPSVSQEVRRLDQQAESLDHLGQHNQARRLRRDAVALASAEAQRLKGLADAYDRVDRISSELRYAWQARSPADSYRWFLQHCDAPDVVQLRWRLKREQGRIAILEDALV